MISIHGEPVVYIIPFLCVNPITWQFTTKKQPKMDDILFKFLPGDPREIRTFSEKYALTSNIRTNKLKTQKTIFPIFPKIGSGTCRGYTRTHYLFWCIYPVFITFCPFLSIVPGGYFDQFWTKWLFENFEKDAKC